MAVRLGRQQATLVSLLRSALRGEPPSKGHTPWRILVMEGNSSPGSQQGLLLTVVGFETDAEQMRAWGQGPAHQRAQDVVVREEMVSWWSEEAMSLV